MRQRFWQGTFKTLGLLGLTAGLAAQAAEPSGKALSAAAGVPWPAVIAHRGASYDAPRKPPRPTCWPATSAPTTWKPTCSAARRRTGRPPRRHPGAHHRRRRGLPGARQDPVSSFTRRTQAPGRRLLVQSRLPRARPARLRRPAHPHPRRDARHRRGRRPSRACTWRPRYRRNSPASKTTCASCWNAAAGCNPASAPPPGMSTWPTAMAG